jgi:hypothetical protein
MSTVVPFSFVISGVSLGWTEAEGAGAGSRSTDKEDGKLVKGDVAGVSVEAAAGGGSIAVFNLNVGATIGNLAVGDQKC